MYRHALRFGLLILVSLLLASCAKRFLCADIAEEELGELVSELQATLVQHNDEELQEWIDTTVKAARERKHHALRCMPECDQKWRQMFWDRWYVYGSLESLIGDFSDPALAGVDEQSSAGREEIVRRLEFVSEIVGSLERARQRGGYSLGPTCPDVVPD
ncbi:MAG: hypothetical protein KF823_00715 [Xanthomonadales bacterium]|nr:hypothetical protein [Xanthomonadales bacterium]